jgi:hypothetical protein
MSGIIDEARRTKGRLADHGYLEGGFPEALETQGSPVLPAGTNHFIRAKTRLAD